MQTKNIIVRGHPMLQVNEPIVYMEHEWESALNLEQFGVTRAELVAFYD